MQDLPAPANLDSGVGLWGEIVIQPGGLWKNANQETLILPKQGARPDFWQMAIAPAPLIPNAKKNVYHETLAQDKTKENINLWEDIDEDTLILPRVKRSLTPIRNYSKRKPVRITGWELKGLTNKEGHPYWILKNMDMGSYMRLNEQQVFIWNHIDGVHSLEDLSIALFFEYKTLVIEGLNEFIEQLEQNWFLEDEYHNIYEDAEEAINQTSVLFQIRKFLKKLLSWEFSIKKVDEFYSYLYQAIGRFIYHPFTIRLIVLVAMIGIPAYIFISLRNDYSLINQKSPYIEFISLWIAQFFAIFIHESGHALTTKHFGRNVRRGGVGLYLGLPAYFMDTTDIWMEPRKARLAVTWAGPQTGFMLSGITSIILIFLAPSPAANFLYKFATFCFFASILNLNPLIKYDGYYMLMDWLEIPLLREKSFKFVREELGPKLKGKAVFSRQERIFSVYGVISLLFTAAMIIYVAVFYGKSIISFVINILSFAS